MKDKAPSFFLFDNKLPYFFSLIIFSKLIQTNERFKKKKRAEKVDPNKKLAGWSSTV